MFCPALRQRSTALELLDAPDIPQADLWRNLAELETINRWLGGHRVTLKGLETLLQDKSRVWRIVDIGCGGGDTLRAIALWAAQKGISVELSGVDLKPDCLAYARQACRGLDIEWITADYRHLKTHYDIVLTSLFCHHLTDEELKTFLSWCHSHATVGLLINDLHRHPLAWWGIVLLTKLFSRSYLVRHDAPLSVWRGFQRSEWLNVLGATGWKAEVTWCWAFRYRILGYV